MGTAHYADYVALVDITRSKIRREIREEQHKTCVSNAPGAAAQSNTGTAADRGGVMCVTTYVYCIHLFNCNAANRFLIIPA